MTILSKFNNIDDEIRNEKVKKINKIIKNKYESRNHEKNAYNLSINQSKEHNISRYWYNIRFKEIYENNINNLCLNLKYKTNNKNINYMEMNKYFKNNHNIDEIELLELLRTTNTDYSNTPLPILSQPSFISDEIIKKINSYNEKNGTNLGFHISDIFALEEKPKKKKNDSKYLPKFQLEKSEDGRELLIKILRMIEDSDDSNNKKTIMKIAENIQNKYNSRKSNIQNPKLMLIFLPMGQSINILQKTLMRFIKDNKLFENYHCCASCSNYKSDEDGDKKFLDFVDKEMDKTKINKKRGCFLFLGDQGRIGITYPDCDITISLDNGQEISKIKQTYYRSLTEADGKTVGINFDMNIQRVYSYISYIIREYKKNNNDNRSYKEILQYLYEIEQFIFNPDELGFGNSKELVIEYFDKYEEKLKSGISAEAILENIICDDDLNEFITQICLKHETIINPILEGIKPDCPEGNKDKTKVDSINDIEGGDSNKVTQSDETDDPFFNINKTKKLCQYMTPLICLLLRKDKIHPNNKHKSNVELLDIIKTNKIYNKLLLNKIKENFKIQEIYLNNIIDKYIDKMTSESNEYILDEIFEIYARSHPKELRKVIEKHFIPSEKQRKEKAEIPTSCECCDEMLNKLPKSFCKKKNKILEPCCGKGNFVLAIFDKYFDGLSHIEDELERCRIIIEECIYFCDIDELNVHITKELLSCHAASKLGKDYGSLDSILKIYDFKYNIYIGNTLNLNINKVFKIKGFNAVIGNPPYQGTGTKKIYFAFVRYILDNLLLKDGYLLFITPQNILKYLLGIEINENKINKFYNIIYFNSNKNIKEKYFKDIGSDFCYYLLTNNDYQNKTEIIYNNGDKNIINLEWKKEINLNSKDQTFIPILYKVLNFNKDKTLWERKASRIEDKIKDGVLITQNLYDNCSDEHPNKIVFKIHTNNIIYKWSDKTKPDTFKYKILYPTLGDNIIIDKDKNLFPGTSFVPYVLCDNINECNFLVTFSKSKLLKYIGDNYNTRNIIDVAFKNLIKYDKVIKNNITDKDIYSYFNITDEEIKIIESSI